MDIESAQIVLADEPDPGLRIGKRDPLPVAQRSAADAADGFERRMPRFEQLFAGRQELPFGAERIGRFALLFRREGLSGSEPSETDPHGNHRGPQPLGRIGRIGYRPSGRFIEQCARHI